MLAVNCYAFGGEWRFAFAKNKDLPTSNFKKYTEEQRKQLIASLVPVTWPPQPPFTDDPFTLLDELVEEKDILSPVSEEKIVKKAEKVEVIKVQDKS